MVSSCYFRESAQGIAATSAIGVNRVSGGKMGRDKISNKAAGKGEPSASETIHLTLKLCSFLYEF